MSIISETFPQIDVALELEPEELAVPLLECLCRFEEQNYRSGQLNRYNFTLPHTFTDYCNPNQYEAIAKAVTEAWVWLEREGLIAPKPKHDGEWVFVTRRGKKFRESGNIMKYKAANLLPHETLDPRLAVKVRPPFLRGDYDSALFEAFKEVEICVRELAGLDATDLGVNLMRKAFKQETGMLTDTGQVLAEQQGISDIFSGAIASFKNPTSHRDINYSDPVEVVELIMFADLLIRIAKRRENIANVSDVSKI